MPSLEISESALKRSVQGNYKYNSNGFIIISWGIRDRHHFRVDLDPWESGRYQKIDGRDYRYKIREFHVKMDAAEDYDFDKRDYDRDYDYLCFVYSSDNIWTPTWSFKKMGRGPQRRPAERGLNAEEWGYASKVSRNLIYEFGKASGKPQMVKMDDELEDA